jgi:alpha,alpha-trehalose phosphorylase
MKKSHNAHVQPIYPIEDWAISETRFDPLHNKRSETLFALANGYIGMRGAFEEAYHGPHNTSVDGTYLNGFYETEPIKYPEAAYGFAENSQTLLNVANAKRIDLFINDEPFDLFTGEVLFYHRQLDLRRGLLSRTVHWRSPAGHEVEVQFTRVVSLARKSIAALRMTVTALSSTVDVRFDSWVDGDVTNLKAGNDPRVGSGLHGRVLDITDKRLSPPVVALGQKTRRSGMALACAATHSISTPTIVMERDDALQTGISYLTALNAGSSITLDKFIAYTSTPDYPADQLIGHALEHARQAQADGFEAVLAEHSAYLARFWARADVQIEGDPALQQGVRLNMFHLLQSVGRDGHTNIAAKGLTGEGYEGHYFWDTEMYVIPFFLSTHPDIARKLLQYRHHILPQARQRARDLAHPTGALYPWRTIGGEECSSYFPAGTAQYHINADIAHAVKRYVESADDVQFLLEHGAEILFETARVWAHVGFFNPRKGGAFCITGVTGPDEYTAIVDNNLYTNLMAQQNLNYAAEVAYWLSIEHPQRYAELQAQLSLTDDEVAQWRQAAERMYIPYDAESGLYLQDDGFLDRPRWDFDNTPDSHYPLLLHYHPLVIYRHQVCKQADLVLAMFLQTQRFTLEDKRRCFDYYEGVTTHDSSLSACIFSIMAAEIGQHDKAYQYFVSTARMDLDDYHGNVKDGVHIANMAGTWMGIVYGFGGMRQIDGQLFFRPTLPSGWQGYSFSITHQNRLLHVHVSAGQVTYSLLEGEPLTLQHEHNPITLAVGTPAVRPLAAS